MQRKKLQSRKSLQARKSLSTTAGQTGLKRKTLLKRSVKPKSKRRVPLSEKTSQQLIKEADKWFSKYVRLRDSEFERGDEPGWYTHCISCNRKYMVRAEDGRWTNSIDNGHYVSRSYKIVRFDEENCSGQCKRCNKWLSGNLIQYKLALERKYGPGTGDKLEKLAQENPYHYLRKDYLLQVIHDSKLQIHYMENQHA